MKRREFIGLLGGAAASWPFVGRAQQLDRMPVIGHLWHAGSESEEAIFLGAFRRGLKDLGYVEGDNIALVNTYADEKYERFTQNAAELVARKVDVLVAVTRPAALAGPTCYQGHSYRCGGHPRSGRKWSCREPVEARRQHHGHFQHGHRPERQTR